MNKRTILLKRVRLLRGGIIICVMFTVVILHILYVLYSEKVLEWNVLAREAFVEALRLEVEKRSDISVPIININSVNTYTLTEPLPDSVTIESEYGKQTYKIQKEKLKHSLVKERRKRVLLSFLLEEYPVLVDTLNQRWDSLLLEKQVVANTYIRYSTTDLFGSTAVAYSRGDKKILKADSLLSCYMGVRCEMEATGFASYNKWRVLAWWQWIFLIFPWGCLCGFMLFYDWMLSYLRRKFGKKELVIQEKEIIVEKEISVATMKVEKAKCYKLEDGVYFDSLERILRNGKQEKTVAPQVANLLKLFFRAKNGRLTAEEICLEMWGSDSDQEKLHTLIHRLRRTLKSVSSLVISYDGNGMYQLKSPYFIEEIDALEPKI